MRRAAFLAVIGILAVLTALRAELWRSPEALWNDAVAGSPAKPRPALALTLVLLDQGKYAEAARVTEEWIPRAPRRERFEFLQNAGQAWLSLGDWRRAASRFESAARQEQSAVAWMNAGSAHYHGWVRGEETADAGYACYRRSIELEPIDGAIDGAADMVRPVGKIHADWNEPISIYTAGKVAFNRGDWPHAAKWIGRAAELRPQWKLFAFNHAYAAANAKDFKTAEAEYRRALTLDPLFREARINLVAVLKAQGKTSEASAETRLLGKGQHAS